jgi:hypothetical protein
MTGPQDTTDLRSGAPLHDGLLALLPLVGLWRGEGTGVGADGATFHYQQQLRFAHDGRPFLAYEARAVLVDETGAMIRPAWRESGFWRPGASQDDIEVVLAAATGLALVYTGRADDRRWEIATATAASAPTAKVVDVERRLYGLLGEELVYATELAPAGRPLAPHLNARLRRA